MFIENKYTVWYYNIVSNRKQCPSISVYTEKHHILPKSLGGTDEERNIVRLTAREHFVVHKLLCKMLEGDNKRRMVYAYFRMCVPQSRHHLREHHSRDYAKARKLVSEIMRTHNPMFREEVKEKFRHKRPEQSLVAQRRNEQYWSDNANKTALSKRNVTNKSKMWQLRNIETNETITTNRLKHWCISNDVSYSGLMSAKRNNRQYKNKWELTIK